MCVKPDVDVPPPPPRPMQRAPASDAGPLTGQGSTRLHAGGSGSGPLTGDMPARQGADAAAGPRAAACRPEAGNCPVQPKATLPGIKREREAEQAGVVLSKRPKPP